MISDTATIAEFLNEAAARKPTPGGGSVAALSGALAAAMGEMVLHYSLGKKGLEKHAAALKLALAEMNRARMLLIGLMKEDQSAFEALTSARQNPPHRRAMAAAQLACITVPQTVGAAAVAILEVCDKNVDIVNDRLISDWAVCVDLAMATTRCAMHNIEVNLPEIADPKQRKAIDTSSQKMLARALEIVKRLAPDIARRMKKP